MIVYCSTVQRTGSYIPGTCYTVLRFASGLRIYQPEAYRIHMNNAGLAYLLTFAETSVRTLSGGESS